MKKKINCWEFKNCNREPNGVKVETLGVCPASEDIEPNGVNDGENGGRMCWAVAGTLCYGRVQGSFAQKEESCRDCDFYKLVQGEEGKFFIHFFIPSRIGRKMGAVKKCGFI